MLALTLILVLISCGNRGTLSPELFGSWAWEAGELFQYTFNEDGTGVRGFPDERDTFRWSNPEAGRLTIRRDNERRNEQWSYTITGYTLTIVSRQADLTHSYIRINAATGRPMMTMIEPPPTEHILIGTWAAAWAAEYKFIFNADGTGKIGELPNIGATIQWTIPEAGHLEVRYEGAILRWNYTVEGNTLTLNSRQVDRTQNFIRVESTEYRETK